MENYTLQKDGFNLHHSPDRENPSFDFSEFTDWGKLPTVRDMQVKAITSVELCPENHRILTHNRPVIDFETGEILRYMRGMRREQKRNCGQVLAAIVKIACWHTGEFILTCEQIAERANLPIYTVYRVMRDLRNAGYVTYHGRVDKPSKSGNKFDRVAIRRLAYEVYVLIAIDGHLQTMRDWKDKVIEKLEQKIQASNNKIAIASYTLALKRLKTKSYIKSKKSEPRNQAKLIPDKPPPTANAKRPNYPPNLSILEQVAWLEQNPA